MINQNSLLDNIRKNVNEETAKKIEDVSYESNIYILYAVDIIPVTQKGLEIGFAAYHARFPDRTYDDFLRYKKNWKEDKFTFDVYPMGYFIDEKTAVDYTESNMGDINEAGAYPYAIVSQMPLNRVYPHCNTRNARLFLFNKGTERYEKIGWDYSEGTKILEERGEGGLF